MNIKSEQAIFEVHADFCHVLSSSTRIMILWLLADGEKSVTELADTLELPVPNVSQHLRIMRDRGAVLTRKEGQSQDTSNNECCLHRLSPPFCFFLNAKRRVSP